MKEQTISPWSWQDNYGNSQGVHVVQPQRTLYAAGQGPIDPDGRLLHQGDVAAQARRTMDNVEAVLDAAGMSLSGMVRYDIRATDFRTTSSTATPRS